MLIDEELRHRIGLALNEATLLGIEFDEAENRVACSMGVISMHEDGSVPGDNLLLVVLNPVGRFVASYRKGHWDDENAAVEKMEPADILQIVKRFNGESIYGWDFVNCGDEDFDTWKDRLSFDYVRDEKRGFTNTIDLFQAGFNEHLDIRIWFDDFEILTPDYKPVELEEFLENGKRGWEAIYVGNPKMSGFGIIPAANESEENSLD